MISLQFLLFEYIVPDTNDAVDYGIKAICDDLLHIDGCSVNITDVPEATMDDVPDFIQEYLGYSDSKNDESR